MEKHEKLALIRETGVIAVMRSESSEALLTVTDALQQGGVSVVEVTMTTPGALDVIREAAKRYGGTLLFGAGSVLDAETARAAILAGAGFIVSPTLDVKMIAVCSRYSIPVLPGCFTPTECLTAWQAGADMIKLFPASVGGPALVKAIKAPLPQIEIVAVGGVNTDNAAEYIRHGAVAVGAGSSLAPPALIEAGDMTAITERARAFRRLL